LPRCREFRPCRYRKRKKKRRLQSSMPPAPPQPQHATLALDTGPYRQQVDEPLQHEPYVDELLEQAEAAAASAQVQAQVQVQLLNSGVEFDPSTASDALEQPQQYEPTALQDDLPQQ
jgi:hypothetical protein